MLDDASRFNEKLSPRPHVDSTLDYCSDVCSAVYLTLSCSQEIKQDRYQDLYQVLVCRAIPASRSESPYEAVTVVVLNLTARCEALATAFKVRYRVP